MVPVVPPRLPQGLQGGTTFSSRWFRVVPAVPKPCIFSPIRLWARLYPQFCKTLLIRISSRFPMRSGFSPIASRKTSLARKNSQFRGSSLVIRSGVSSHFSTVSSQASLMVYCSWTLAASCSASRNWIPPDAETPHEPQPKVKGDLFLSLSRRLSTLPRGASDGYQSCPQGIRPH